MHQILSIAADKMGYPHNNFLITSQKMFSVLIKMSS